MKKFTYYFINQNGEKQKVRQSLNEYLYGLVIKEGDKEYCIKCSIRKDIIENEMRYIMKHWDDMSRFSGKEQKEMRIAVLIKE